ncbi:mitochondrial carrier domain-containing protein [Lyophyllum atratum]|nr:mitochondrial carrier domain-containing protein [Lyophyllum atratum]
MSSNVPSRSRDKQSFHYIIRSTLAGGIAGCVAKTVVAPLDRVKILFQASNPDFRKYAGSWSGAFRAGAEIYRQAGVRGLFQGHSVTLLRIFPYAGIKFMAYDQVHSILMPTREQETNARRFLAGAISGTMSVFVTYPLDVIRVRMAFHTKSPTPLGGSRPPTFTQVFRHIYNERTTSTATPHPGARPIINAAHYIDRFPILKFYRGFSVTIAGMIPYAGVSFLSWGYLRARFLPANKAGHKPPTPFADLVIGAVSGVIAQTASYPFEIIRRRMQVGGITHPDRWLRWGETIRAIWQCGGWRGFYVGLTIGYLKVVPMTAVSFTVWQGAKRMLDV